MGRQPASDAIMFLYEAPLRVSDDQRAPDQQERRVRDPNARWQKSI